MGSPVPFRVRVAPGSEVYDVLVGPALLDRTGSLISEIHTARTVALVTDSNVAALYAGAVEQSLTEAGISCTRIVVPAGESTKSLTHVETVCDAMIRAGLDRSSLLIALGGGVIGDLAGFVAAVYFRGIPYVQIPTTVVSQVDSAVGGKTGVNAAAGKNLIGAFHQPALVIADTDTLASLPEREFNEGMAEVIKHAVIRDPDLFERLSTFDREDTSALAALIALNVGIKAAIVSEDEFETKDLRALLNFGHTIGHGIENAAGYGRFLHGEAISLGLVAAAGLSVIHAGLSQDSCAAIRKLLEKFKLPVRLPVDIRTSDILAAMARDKKFKQGRIRFVLTPRIGEAIVSSEITASDIEAAVEALR